MHCSKFLLLVCASLPTTALPVTFYTDEASYLEALSARGYRLIHEGFEDDDIWADARPSASSSGKAPFVVSQGIRWSSNYGSNDVSTGALGGSVADGNYGFFSIPHGNQETTGTFACATAEEPDIPAACWQQDGWIGGSETAGTLYGVGGWISGSLGSKATILLDGIDYREAPESRDGTRVGDWTFVGVIDPAGFSSFEVRELGGKGGQNQNIFADAFTLGASSGPQPPKPDIKVNGSGTASSLLQGTPVSVTVSLEPGDGDGTAADWWVAATSPFGVFWYTLDRGWINSGTPISVYAGALFRFSSYPVLSKFVLPAGAYTFYFGVDGNMDGNLDATHVDSVPVTIE